MKIKNKYSFCKKIQLAWWILRTKLICSKARLIRFPFDVRGKKYIDFGRNLTTGIGCRIEAFSKNENKTMLFGDNVQMNDYVHICSMRSVKIGNNVLIAGKVYISDNSHGFYKGDKTDSSPEQSPIKRNYYISPVEIQDNVWLGENVVILPGVKIGRGSIIGANSVVSKSIAANSIAVGAPAQIIKQYNFETKIWEKVN